MGEVEQFTVSSLRNTLWFKAQMAPQIFCLHNRWNGENVAKLYAPFGSQPYYFSILRDPVALFISLWDYYGLSQKMNGTSLQEFAMSPDKPETIIVPGHLNYKHSLLWDMGVGADKHDDGQYVREKIRELDKTFDLMLLVEYFRESMVLLKHDICWQYEDLVSLKLNARTEESKSHIDNEAMMELRTWLKTSYLLYDYFKVLIQAL